LTNSEIMQVISREEIHCSPTAENEDRMARIAVELPKHLSQRVLICCWGFLFCLEKIRSDVWPLAQFKRRKIKITNANDEFFRNCSP
uniref:CNNM transmembrane domain-containing protein n=1 Tax=Toxocara canis TaxID=6265 RepID=A0A183U558_TOXCA